MTESVEIIQFLLNQVIDNLSKKENDQKIDDETCKDQTLVSEDKFSEHANKSQTDSINISELSSSLEESFLKEFKNNKTSEDDSNYLSPENYSYSTSDSFENKNMGKETRPINSTPIESFNRLESSLENNLDDINNETYQNFTEEIYEDKEANEYLNKTIEDAIDKYEKEEKHFTEVSVQTNYSENLFPECSCVKRKLKSEVLKDDFFEFENSKKIKRNKEYFFVGYKNICSSSEKPELVENKIKSDEKVDSAETTSVFDILKATPRFRLGLSKKAKPFAVSL